MNTWAAVLGFMFSIMCKFPSKWTSKFKVASWFQLLVSLYNPFIWIVCKTANLSSSNRTCQREWGVTPLIPGYSPGIQLDPDTVYQETALWCYLIRYHRLGVSPTRLLLPLPHPFKCHLQAQVVPSQYFWLISYKSEIPTTPNLGLISLIEELTEFRETSYILDHRFIRKHSNSGTARLKRCVGQGLGRGLEPPRLAQVYRSPSTFTCSQHSPLDLVC